MTACRAGGTPEMTVGKPLLRQGKPLREAAAGTRHALSFRAESRALLHFPRFLRARDAERNLLCSAAA